MAVNKRKRIQKLKSKSKKVKVDPEVLAAEEVENKRKEIPDELDKMAALVPKGKWTNKQKVLIFSSRGVSYKGRHFFKDLQSLMPHTKTDCKMDRKGELLIINEICEMKNCNKCLFLVGKKKQDLYMWASNVPHGPSALFYIDYLNMMKELKFSGNCLKGSRPLLSFDKEFDAAPHYRLVKEIFTQIFGTPRYHPKSQPFVDHVLNFSILDGKVWFRNYQIAGENGELIEIGPRYTMTLVRILSGSFGGPVLYINPDYKSPNFTRRMIRLKTGKKYVSRQEVVMARQVKKSKQGKTYKTDETDLVFQTH